MFLIQYIRKGQSSMKGVFSKAGGLRVFEVVLVGGGRFTFGGRLICICPLKEGKTYFGKLFNKFPISYLFLARYSNIICHFTTCLFKSMCA